MKKLTGYLLSFIMVALLVVTTVVPVDAKTTKKTTAKATTTTTEATTEASKAKKEEKEAINFYIFYGSTCGYCAKLHEYVATLEKDEKINYMFNVVDYEVWADEVNSSLMQEVGEYFKTQVTGVPFYVIGEKYFSGYSSATSDDEIVEAIKEAYNNKKYKDVVASIGTGNVTVADSETTEEDADETDKNNLVGYIILGIALIIVVAIIFGSSKNRYYDEDEEEVEEKEEVKVEAKKVETKKTEKKEVVKEETKKVAPKQQPKKTTNKSTATKKNTKKK